MPTEPQQSPLRFIYEFQCRECKYKRHMGHAKVSAESKAVRHASSRRHDVDVYETDLTTLSTRVLHEYRPKKHQLDLMDQPPF